MAKRILIDFVTLVIGSGVFVGYALNSRDEELAGIGAGMVVLGLLIREWRTFSKKTLDTSDRNVDEGLSDKTAVDRNLKGKALLIALLSILTFTMWGSNKSKIDNHEHYWEFQRIQSKLGDIEGSFNSIEERLEEVEERSHYHRGY